MADPQPDKRRSSNPLCARERCHHPRTLHGVAREQCKGMGCSCPQYLPPEDSDD